MKDRFRVIRPGERAQDGIPAETLPQAKRVADEVNGTAVEEREPGKWFTVYDPFQECGDAYDRHLQSTRPTTLADLKWLRPDLYW